MLFVIVANVMLNNTFSTKWDKVQILSVVLHSLTLAYSLFSLHFSNTEQYWKIICQSIASRSLSRSFSSPCLETSSSTLPDSLLVSHRHLGCHFSERPSLTSLYIKPPRYRLLCLPVLPSSYYPLHLSIFAFLARP